MKKIFFCKVGLKLSVELKICAYNTNINVDINVFFANVMVLFGVAKGRGEFFKFNL